MSAVSFRAPSDDLDLEEEVLVSLSALDEEKEDEEKKPVEVVDEEFEEVDELKALDRLEKELERESLNLNETEDIEE